MSQIPSDIPASAAQAGFQAQEVAKERDGRRSGQAHAANRQVRTTDEAGTVVDTDDADVAAFADAEGGGSEGREVPAETEEQAPEGAASPDEGVTRDADGRFHVDLEA